MCETPEEVENAVRRSYENVMGQLKNYLRSPKNSQYISFGMPKNADDYEARVAIYNYCMGHFKGAIFLYHYDIEYLAEDESLELADREVRRCTKAIRDTVFKIPKAKIKRIIDETKVVRRPNKTR